MSAVRQPAAWRSATVSPRGRWALGAALFAAGALVCALTVLRGIQPNDEGLMLQAAGRIAGGEVPYRDFWWYYPPGQPYLLAALWKISGPSLLDWRIVRVLANALVATLAWALAGRRAPGWAAVAVWVVALLAMAYPSGPHPFPLALAFALGALLLFERHPAWAGILLGACGAWRIEFAAYLALGMAVATALNPERGHRGRSLALVLGTGALTTVALYLPVVAQAGVSRSWELLVNYPVTDFGDYQGLPFPLAYHGPLNTSSVAGFFGDTAENLLVWWLPLAAVLGLLGATVSLLCAFQRASDWPIVATIVFAVGMGHYLLVRPDLFHTAPLVVMVSILAAWSLGAARERSGSLSGARRVLAWGGAAIAAIAVAWALVEGLDRQWLLLRQPTAAVAAPPAHGVRTDRRLAATLSAAVAQARRLTGPGEPIYVLGRRADITTAGAPLFYVLAERPNPTRYDIAAPGVVTSAPVQQEIIGDLRAARPGAVVRWDSRLTAAPEPNRSGRSSGVRLLDAYIASSYRTYRRYGDWVILVARR